MQLNFRVDLWVINLAVPGSVDFIAALQQANRDSRVIGVLNDSVEMVNLPRVNAIHFKGSLSDEAAKIDWLKCVHGVLTHTGAAAG